MNFQSSLRDKYRKEGYKVVKIIKLSENGYADLMLLKEGYCGFIESKEEKDTLKPLQKFRIDELIDNGFDACCMQKNKGIIYGTFKGSPRIKDN